MFDYVGNKYSFPSMTPRSTNTISTFHEKKRSLELKDKQAKIHPSVNLQKTSDNGDLSGILSVVSPEADLSVLDFVGEDSLNGISIVRCNMDESDISRILKDTDHVERVLQDVANTQGRFPRLSDILPNVESQDFIFQNMSCVFVCDDTVKAEMVSDCERQNFNFYDAFEFMHRVHAQDGEEADNAIRDGCSWEPALKNGMLGLFQQNDSEGVGFYLVCTCGIPSLASEVFNALKSDVSEHCSVANFIDSKELFCIQNLAQRNRLRLIYKAAEALKLRIKSTVDIMAHEDDPTQQIAVQTCGVSHEYLNLMARNVSNESQQSVVTHAKGCLDLKTHRGPIPIWIGKGHEVLVMVPRCMSTQLGTPETDSCQYEQGTDIYQDMPFPTLNIYEDNMGNIMTIEAEKRRVGKLHVHDIAHNIMTQSTPANLQHALSILNMQDENHKFIFQGCLYEEPLPLLLYPQITTKFKPISTKRNFRKYKHACGRHARKNYMRKNCSYRSAKIPQTDAANILFQNAHKSIATVEDMFGFEAYTTCEEDETVVMDWDDYTLGVLSKMAMGDEHALKAIHLSPIISLYN